MNMLKVYMTMGQALKHLSELGEALDNQNYQAAKAALADVYGDWASLQETTVQLPEIEILDETSSQGVPLQLLQDVAYALDQSSPPEHDCLIETGLDSIEP
jgi:hypothetical protein